MPGQELPSSRATRSARPRWPGVERTSGRLPSRAASAGKSSSAPTRKTTRLGKDSWTKRTARIRKAGQVARLSAHLTSDIDRIVQAFQQRLALILELRRDDKLGAERLPGLIDR